MRNMSIHFLAAVLALSFTATAYAQQKIAVVDLEKLIRLHPNTVEDKKTLEGTLKDFNKQKEQLQALAASTRKAFEEAAREATNPALSESARKKAETVALDKRQAALEAARGAEEKIRELQRELNKQEMKMLRRTSERISTRAAGGFAMLCVSITFHEIYNVLLAAGGVAMYVAFAAPILTCVVLFARRRARYQTLSIGQD